MNIQSLLTLLAALTAIIGIVIAIMKLEALNSGQEKIHVLVNSRLTEALNKIGRLEARLLLLTGEKPVPERLAPPNTSNE